MEQPVDHLDGPISWREVGGGAPVVFLHGLGGTRMSWEPQLAGLGTEFRCLAWDMPGYGASDPVDPLTFEAIAEAVVALMDATDVDSAHLCGLSFGGQHALHTALAHPDRVRSLILADTSPAFGLDGTDPNQWKASRLAAIDEGLSPADIADTVIDAITAPSFAGEIRDATVAAMASIPSAGFRAACECLPTHDVRGRLHRINCPTTIVVGEHDRETPIAYSQALHNGIAGSRLFIVEAIGHLSPSEAPLQFNEIVRTAVRSAER